MGWPREGSKGRPAMKAAKHSPNVVLGIPNCLAALLTDQFFFILASTAAARKLACAVASNILVFSALAKLQFNREGRGRQGRRRVRAEIKSKL